MVNTKYTHWIRVELQEFEKAFKYSNFKFLPKQKFPQSDDNKRKYFYICGDGVMLMIG